MARYFFDTSDGLRTSVDDVGVDAADDNRALCLALEGLADMAKDGIPFGGTSFAVAVWDAGRRLVYEAQVDLKVQNGRLRSVGREGVAGSLTAEGDREHFRAEIEQPI